jgi:hypothetical protein
MNKCEEAHKFMSSLLILLHTPANTDRTLPACSFSQSFTSHSLFLLQIADSYIFMAQFEQKATNQHFGSVKGLGHEIELKFVDRNL